jgi:hypothetical protein
MGTHRRQTPRYSYEWWLTRTGNLPMTRVKYQARADYEYLDNFKILQACFKKNGIDKVSWNLRLRRVSPLPMAKAERDLRVCMCSAGQSADEQPIPVDKLVKCVQI